MPSISDLLAAKIEADSLNNMAAAKKIGVSLPSLRNALSGKSLPNVRTIPKLAKFLGVSEEDISAEVAAAKGGGKKAKGGRGKKAAKAEKAPKAEKAAKRGRGRPKGSGKAAAGAVSDGAKPARGRGRGKGKRAASGDVGAAMAAVQSALDAANALMGDSLALTVHNLPATKRKLIESIVANF